MGNPIADALSSFARAVGDIGGSHTAAALVGALAFGRPTVTLQNHQLKVCGRIQDALNERVEAVLETGTPVAIHIQGELTGEHVSLNSVSVLTLRYDTLAKQYWAGTNGHEEPIQSPQTAFGSYCLPFRGVDRLEGLSLEAEARIGYSSSIALEDADEALWDHQRPYLKVKNLGALSP